MYWVKKEVITIPTSGTIYARNFQSRGHAFLSYGQKTYYGFHHSVMDPIQEIPDWLKKVDYLITCHPNSFREKYPSLASKVIGHWNGKTLVISSSNSVVIRAS